MDDDQPIKISKNTQKFITDVSNLPPHKYDKVMGFLENLKEQQNAEGYMEDKRGWRLMWERTPKPYLLALGYFVFLAPAAGFGFSNVPETDPTLYLLILWSIFILPLILVSYLSIVYINRRKKEIEVDKDA